MHRKLITACMALAAFMAFAVVPSISSASPELTHPTGTTLKVGSKIDATNVGDTLMTDAGGGVLTRCSSATMTGTVTSNTGTAIAADISTATFSGTAAGGACTGSFGSTTPTPKNLPWCIKSTKTADQFEVRGGACSEASKPITFILDAPFGVECKYSRTSAILGTFATHPSDAVLTISKVEFPGESTPFPCPSTGYLDMSFTLETDTPTAEPIYIS